MNRQESIKRVQALEKELAELKKIIGSPEERFLQLVGNVKIKRDLEKYPNSIFFFNGGKCLAEYHADYPENLWISWDIWGVFENEYKMKYAEIQEFMREQLKKHFKMYVIEPRFVLPSATRLLEKHFKMKAREK